MSTVPDMTKHGWPVGAILSCKHPWVTCVKFIVKRHLLGHGKDIPDGICLIIRVEKSLKKKKNKVGNKLSFQDISFPKRAFCSTYILES